MPNGRPGDNPLTDLLVHGMHAFPPDMEEMIVELHGIDRSIFDDMDVFRMLSDWELSKNLDEGREWLRGQLQKARGQQP